MTSAPLPPHQNISFSDFLSAIEAHQIASVDVEGEKYFGKFAPEYNDGAYFMTLGPALKERPLEILAKSGTHIEYRQQKETPLWKAMLMFNLPTLLLGGCIGFFAGWRIRRKRNNQK